MKMICQSVALFLVLPVFNLSFVPQIPVSKTYRSHFENVLGTSFELKVRADSEGLADEAEVDALKEIDRLSGILSAYDASSEFSRWNKNIGQPVRVSTELFDILSLFDHWKSQTNGALDASAEAISKTWKKASAAGTIPSKQDINQALLLVRQQQWILDTVNMTATRIGSSPLMLNSFVKSYIINKVTVKLSRMNGIHAVLVNIGGDIVVIGDLKEEINVSDPRADAENDIPVSTIQLSDAAIATSGNYRRGYSIGSQWYSHIVDPRTGFPADKIISATVISPNATTAGALATAFNILSIEESERLAALNPGTEYLIITSKGGRVQSNGWGKLEVKAENSGKKILAQSDFELLIDMELALFEGRFRRPFVAIWVVDSKKKTVRNLALWFNKPRWLPDLKEWYRSNYQDLTANGKDVETISSATRPPGKYSIKWDMKDDAGMQVPSGKYTIYIEAAREHGTYQLIKKEIDCKKKEQNISLPGNTEISSASLQYRKTLVNN